MVKDRKKYDITISNLACVTGDGAIGKGVTRFFLSTCIEKLKSGFCINFGKWSAVMCKMTY